MKREEKSKAVFTISGLDCSACVINLDGTLEDTTGIIHAETSYAKAQCTVTFDPQQINTKEISQVIKQIGYTPQLNS